MTVPALAERVRELREAARRFAEVHGVARADDVALAVAEACANVVIHAYLDRNPGPLRLTGTRVDGAVSFLVADEGTGLAPRPDSPGLGMGLPLIAQLADHFELTDDGGDGTRVRMRFALHTTTAPGRWDAGATGRRDGIEGR
jgi:serine/threonine-protein kinase RsbW